MPLGIISDIDVGDDVQGSSTPGGIRPVAVVTMPDGRDYPTAVLVDPDGNMVSPAIVGGIDVPWDKIEMDEPGGVLTTVRAYEGGVLVRTLTFTTVGDTTTIEKS